MIYHQIFWRSQFLSPSTLLGWSSKNNLSLICTEFCLIIHIISFCRLKIFCKKALKHDDFDQKYQVLNVKILYIISWIVVILIEKLDQHGFDSIKWKFESNYYRIERKRKFRTSMTFDSLQKNILLLNFIPSSCSCYYHNNFPFITLCKNIKKNVIFSYHFFRKIILLSLRRILSLTKFLITVITKNVPSDKKLITNFPYHPRISAHFLIWIFEYCV